jgi:hypothetical protein
MVKNLRDAERLLLQLGQVLGIRLIVHPSASGRRWVDECITLFENACGPDSVRDVSDKQRPYDLLVCGKKVQCKYRSRNNSGSVKIRNSHRASGGWYADSEVDFFAIAYGSRHFVVPYKSLKRQDGTFLNDMNVSRLWRYENAWNIREADLHEPCGWLFVDETQEATDGTHS